MVALLLLLQQDSPAVAADTARPVQAVTAPAAAAPPDSPPLLAERARSRDTVYVEEVGPPNRVEWLQFGADAAAALLNAMVILLSLASIRKASQANRAASDANRKAARANRISAQMLQATQEALEVSQNALRLERFPTLRHGLKIEELGGARFLIYELSNPSPQPAADIELLVVSSIRESSLPVEAFLREHVQAALPGGNPPRLEPTEYGAYAIVSDAVVRTLSQGWAKLPLHVELPVAEVVVLLQFRDILGNHYVQRVEFPKQAGGAFAIRVIGVAQKVEKPLTREELMTTPLFPTDEQRLADVVVGHSVERTMMKTLWPLTTGTS